MLEEIDGKHTGNLGGAFLSGMALVDRIQPRNSVVSKDWWYELSSIKGKNTSNILRFQAKVLSLTQRSSTPIVPPT